MCRLADGCVTVDVLNESEEKAKKKGRARSNRRVHQMQGGRVVITWLASGQDKAASRTAADGAWTGAQASGRQPQGLSLGRRNIRQRPVTQRSDGIGSREQRKG